MLTTVGGANEGGKEAKVQSNDYEQLCILVILPAIWPMGFITEINWRRCNMYSEAIQSLCKLLIDCGKNTAKQPCSELPRQKGI